MFFQKSLKKLLIRFKWIELHLKNSRNDLSCCCVRTKSCNEANHCRPAIELFCFRSHNRCEIWNKYKEKAEGSWSFSVFSLSRELMPLISRVYLVIEVIWAKCSLLACSLLLARWLFNSEEIDLPLEARFNSETCITFFLACCLSKRLFSSEGLEWLGLEDKNSSALWSEFFLQRLFLIKGRWFITLLSRGSRSLLPKHAFPQWK